MAKKTSEQTHTGKAVTTHLKPASKKSIKELFDNMGGFLEVKGKMTDTIKRDVWNYLKNGVSLIADKLDEIYAGDDDEMIQETKLFVKTELQTIIKLPSVQVELLGEDVKVKNVTIKKVTKPMVEDNGERFEGSYHETDIGKFRVVTELKNKEELTLQEKLEKWMKANGLYDEDSLTGQVFDTECVRAHLDGIDKDHN